MVVGDSIFRGARGSLYTLLFVLALLHQSLFPYHLVTNLFDYAP